MYQVLYSPIFKPCATLVGSFKLVDLSLGACTRSTLVHLVIPAALDLLFYS